MQANVTNKRIAWSLAEIACSTGLSVGFLRKEAKRGTLQTKKFGRRVLVLNEDLENYLSRSNQREAYNEDKTENVSSQRDKSMTLRTNTA
jgi:hypothetical protein